MTDEIPPQDEGNEQPTSDDRELIEAARREAEALRATGSDPGAIGAGMIGDVPAGYEVIREIHRGGQGAVYLAIQKATKRKVAIKVMHAGSSVESAGRARFEREIQILGHLNHPNIVKIHDSGCTEGGQFYYVMDYIPGQPLDEYLKANPDLPPRDAIELFATICEAVNAAHVRGVIHRDLKPANIRVNSDGEPMIVDFGLAKLSVGGDQSSIDLMTITGQFVGSLPWASPEQAGASPEAIDVRTDVYSLGVMLYQLLTHGKFPYDVLANMRDVLDNILHAQPARPSTAGRGINDELDTIVLKCLAKEKERRYQSAGELARDLRHYLRGEPIEAKRDSGLYVISKTLRRYKPQVAVALAFLVAIIAFAIVLGVLLVNVSRQRTIARQNFDSGRELAHTMIFDFHDIIEPLRGATRARDLILTEALAYLQGVRTQGGDDPDFLRELAEANDRVGDLLSARDDAGTGDLQASRERYAEARAIREGLLTRLPDDARARADMGASLARSGLVMLRDGQYDQAINELESAQKRYAEAIAIAGSASPQSATWTDERQTISLDIVDAIVGKITFLAAGERPDPATGRAAHPDADVQTDTLLQRAGAVVDDAMKHFATGLDRAPDDQQALKGLVQAIEHKSALLVLEGRTHAGAAQTLAEAGRQAEAVAECRQAIDAYARARADVEPARIQLDALIERNPDSVSLRRARMMTTNHAGESLMRAAQSCEFIDQIARANPDVLGEGLTLEQIRSRARSLHTDSLELYSDSLERAESLATDESNAAAMADLAFCINKVGRELESLGRYAEALEAYRRSLAIRDELRRSDDTARNRERLGVAEYRLAEFMEGDAERKPERRISLLSEAKTRFENAYDLFKSSVGPDANAARQARNGIQRCIAQLEALLNGGQ